MNVSKEKKFGILLVALAAAAVAGSLSAPDTSAQWVCFCLNPTANQTSVATGYGSTCVQAYNSAKATADTWAAEACAAIRYPHAPCLDDFVVTSECQWTGSQWELSGYTKYRCRECVIE